MYVKIIKCSGENDWYKNFIGNIFNVILEYNLYYLIPKKIGSSDNHYIKPNDCEEINLDFDGKITEEFARKLLNNYCVNNFSVDVEYTLSKWKYLNFIKQSREDELCDLKKQNKQLVELVNELIDEVNKIKLNYYKRTAEQFKQKLKEITDG